MTGYVYNIETRQIVTKVTNVTACNNTTIKGDSKAVLGTGQYVITNQDFNVGDILPEEITDRRSEIQVLV